VENLNNTDIQLLCDYRKKFLCVIEGQSRSLDFTVVKELVSGLLAQDIKKADIAKGLTRVTKLICCYADTGSLARDGDVLPKAIGGNGNEHRRRASLHSPTEPEAGMDGALSFHTVASSSQQLVSSYQIPFSDQQPVDNVIKARTNTAKRQKISGHAAFQTRESPCTTQEDNQIISAPSSEVSLANTQGKHQALDVTTAANVLQSLQHGNQVYTRDTAGIMPQFEHRSQPPPTASVAIPGRYSASEHSFARREASDAAGSNNKDTIDTNTTANHDALLGSFTTTTVDGLRGGITDDHTIENSTGYSMQPINGHSSSRSSLLDGACESRLLSPPPTHTLMPNRNELESGTGIIPTPTIFGQIGEECSKGFESSAPIRLSDYIGPEMIEDIREWETFWSLEET
jgi:hypothetical protein